MGHDFTNKTSTHIIEIRQTNTSKKKNNHNKMIIFLSFLLQTRKCIMYFNFFLFRDIVIKL